jgi:hypothetical protein
VSILGLPGTFDDLALFNPLPMRRPAHTVGSVLRAIPVDRFFGRGFPSMVMRHRHRHRRVHRYRPMQCGRQDSSAAIIASCPDCF